MNEERTAARRREIQIMGGNRTMDKRMDAEPYRMVEEEPANQDIEYFPRLADDKRIRVNRLTGKLYISAFREPGKRNVTGLITEENTIFKRGQNPEAISLRRWNTYPDIETAIRGMEHVFDKYDRQDGEEVDKTKRAVLVMRAVLKEFRTGAMTEERLSELSEMTARELVNAGFVDAEKLIKQKILDQLMLAAGTDSLDRMNPLISRTRIASAWLKTTHELLFAKRVREKYSYLYTLLSAERDLERFHLEQMIRGIDNLLERGFRNREIRRSIFSLEGFSRRYLGLRIPASPYRGASMLAHVMLFGARFEAQRQIAREYAGEEGEALLDLPSIVSVYHDDRRMAIERWEEIADRLDSAKARLSVALQVGEHNLNKEIPAAYTSISSNSSSPFSFL